METAEITVSGADDMTPEEIVEKVKSFRTGSLLFLGCTVFFDMEAGLESQLSDEFPYPDVVDEVKQRLKKECVVVHSRLRSWQDPQHEEQQAAWSLVIAW